MAAPDSVYGNQEPAAEKRVRGKFLVVSITKHNYSETLRTVKLSAIYDSNIPEDLRYLKATPTGSIEMTVDNPVALELLKLGQYLYVDFIPVK